MKPKWPRVVYWIAGTVVALIGVAVARLPSGEFAESNRFLLLVSGTIIAFVGFYIITKGTGTDKDFED
ncbi:MAG: hypothetical protein H7840_07640 [Alphaproteobacteria bacterium]